MILIHGFGANADHWRKNLQHLAASGCTAYALDLLGYGWSGKPDPTLNPPNSVYNFESWAAQCLDFADAVSAPDERLYFAANSIGCSVALSAAAEAPRRRRAVGGLVLLNTSLRGLHVSKQPALARPLISGFQTLLRKTPLGKLFFSAVATPETVRSVLLQAYGRRAAVDEELVELLLSPGRLPNAASVFLDFISYSGGPLPEDDLRRISCPVVFGWGADDPWENVLLGRERFSTGPTVEAFVEWEGVGHCPQDEAPEIVNPFICDNLARWEASAGRGEQIINPAEPAPPADRTQ